MLDSKLLRVLRILSKPYQYPPLNWSVRMTEWLAATTPRFVATMAVSALVVVGAVVVNVIR